jgi:hypothetical protein
MMSLNSIASGEMDKMSQQRPLPLFSNALHQEVGPFTSVSANKDKIYNLKGDWQNINKVVFSKARLSQLAEKKGLALE